MKHFISVRIHERRTSLRLTQTELAARIGVSRALVAMWETGRRVPQPSHLEATANALEVQVSELSFATPVLGIFRSSRTPPDRGPYPIGATLAQMLRVGGCAERIHQEAVQLLKPAHYKCVLDSFPRDTRHELLLIFHVLRQAARPVRAAPLDFRCGVHILDDFESKCAGNQRQIVLRWTAGEEKMLIFGQVRMRGTSSRPRRVDFLVYYKLKGKRGQWIYVELDGPEHEKSPNQDAERDVSIPIPELRYDNVMVESANFFGRLLADVRRRAEDGARWALESRKKARQLRRYREAEATRRRALA